MALPLTLVIVAAEIDLSVASVLALSSALMALAVEQRAAAGADHAAVHRGRRALRRVQRRAGHAARAPVAGRDHRHARAVPRARVRGHRRRLRHRLPGAVDRPRVRHLRRGRSSRTPWSCSPCSRSPSGCCCTPPRSGARSTRSAPTRRPRASPASASAHQARPVRALRRGRRARRRGHLAAQLDRGRERRAGLRADRHHRRAAGRRLDLRRPRHDRRRDPRPAAAGRDPEGAHAERVDLVVLDPDRHRDAADRRRPRAEHRTPRARGAPPARSTTPTGGGA